MDTRSSKGGLIVGANAKGKAKRILKITKEMKDIAEKKQLEHDDDCD